MSDSVRSAPNKLVAIHGFTGSPRSFDALLRDLPEHVAVYRPWVGGHGHHAESTFNEGVGEARRERDAGLFSREVDRLAALVRASGFEGAHLLGYSMGGRLAMGLLVRHPGLFASASLIGARAGLSRATERLSRRRADARLREVLLKEGLETFAARWRALPIFRTQRALPDDVQLRRAEERRGHCAEGLAFSLKAHGLGAMPFYAPKLRAVQVPVTCLAGASDRKFWALARAYASRLPRGRAQSIEGAGHDPVLEQPAAVARHLREYVK